MMPHNAPSTPVGREPSIFQIAVGERSWDWLLELRRQLKVDLLLVDAGAHVLVPATPGESVTGLPALLEQREASVLSAITTGLRVGTPQVMDVAGLQIVSLALSAQTEPAGALVLGRTAPAGQEPLALRVQLELVGSWLRAAVESHLQSPPTLHASGMDRIAPLAALLRRTAEQESDRELVRVFAEAGAVWHDIETCGYVETSGDFVRDVVPPADRGDERPTTLAAADLPDSTDLIQLPQGHLDRFRLPLNTDVFIKRFHRRSGSWLLVFTGAIDAYDLQRLAAYVALLDLALSLSATTLTARLTMTLHRHLAETEAPPEQSAVRALDELRAALGASWARLTIEASDGAPLLAVMSPAGHSGRAARGPVRLGLVKRSEQDYTTTVSLGRATSQPFTPRDHEAAGAALEVFAAWGAAVRRPAPSGRDRRSTPGTFPDAIERSARETMARGAPVAMIVVSARAPGASLGSTQRWVAGIRGQMRALDLVGVLAEGEVGVLLPGTTVERATGVSRRVRGIVEAQPGGASVLLGVAGRKAGSGSGTAAGLLDEARAAALGSASATPLPGPAREARS